MKSILQNEKVCYLCGKEYGLESHHIFAGVANRRISEENGLKVWLCHGCHTGTDGAQYDREKNLFLKQMAQAAYEQNHTHDEWMKLIRKNYI